MAAPPKCAGPPQACPCSTSLGGRLFGERVGATAALLLAVNASPSSSARRCAPPSSCSSAPQAPCSFVAFVQDGRKGQWWAWVAVSIPCSPLGPPLRLALVPVRRGRPFALRDDRSAGRRRPRRRVRAHRRSAASCSCSSRTGESSGQAEGIPGVTVVRFVGVHARVAGNAGIPPRSSWPPAYVALPYGRPLVTGRPYRPTEASGACSCWPPGLLVPPSPSLLSPVQPLFGAATSSSSSPPRGPPGPRHPHGPGGWAAVHRGRGRRLVVAGAVGWYVRPPADDIRGSPRTVAADARTGDAIVFLPGSSELPFDAYALRDARIDDDVRPRGPTTGGALRAGPPGPPDQRPRSTRRSPAPTGSGSSCARPGRGRPARRGTPTSSAPARDHVEVRHVDLDGSTYLYERADGGRPLHAPAGPTTVGRTGGAVEEEVIASFACSWPSQKAVAFVLGVVELGTDSFWSMTASPRPTPASPTRTSSRCDRRPRDERRPVHDADARLGADRAGRDLMRLPSVLFATAVVPVTYLLARRLFDQRPASPRRSRRRQRLRGRVRARGPHLRHDPAPRHEQRPVAGPLPVDRAVAVAAWAGITAPLLGPRPLLRPARGRRRGRGRRAGCCLPTPRKALVGGPRSWACHPADQWFPPPAGTRARSTAPAADPRALRGHRSSAWSANGARCLLRRCRHRRRHWDAARRHGPPGGLDERTWAPSCCVSWVAVPIATTVAVSAAALRRPLLPARRPGLIVLVAGAWQIPWRRAGAFQLASSSPCRWWRRRSSIHRDAHDDFRATTAYVPDHARGRRRHRLPTPGSPG